MTLSALIDRLEKATEGSRELDCDIAVFVEPGEVLWLQANHTMDSYPAIRRARNNYVGGFATEFVPNYTTSLDAALTLVPEGFWWGVRVTTRCFADVGPSNWMDCEAEAKTPELALCIAALKARTR